MGALADFDMQLKAELSVLGVRELQRYIKGLLPPIQVNAARKDKLIEHICRHVTPSIFNSLQELARKRRDEKEVVLKEKSTERKRKHALVQNMRRLANRTEEHVDVHGRDTSRFMQLPSQEQVHQCYRDFFNATNAESLAMAVCALCAREVSRVEDNVTEVELASIPNAYQLKPTINCDAHELFEGMLLEPAGMLIDAEGVRKINICGNCLKEMKKDLRSPPPYSLANNLWVRRILWELDQLTLPEQMLIALLYPRVFVIKLHPKSTT
jgi:hypothetical protein